MQADQQQPWTLYVHAKAKNFDFKLKATKILPTTHFFRFSILFKFCPFLVKVKSQPQVSIFPRKIKSLKSKFLGILEKFPTPRAKNKANAARKTSNIGPFRRWVAYKGPICVSFVVVGNLALFFQSICEKDQKGIVIHSLVILLYLASLLKNFVGRKTHLLVVLSVVMVGCSVMGHMLNHLSYDKGCVSKYVWKAWNYAASSGYLYLISQESHNLWASRKASHNWGNIVSMPQQDVQLLCSFIPVFACTILIDWLMYLELYMLIYVPFPIVFFISSNFMHLYITGMDHMNRDDQNRRVNIS